MKMKIRVAVVMTWLAGVMAAQAVVLAGWCDPSAESPHVSAPGISATLNGAGWGVPKQGSGDDTFGTFPGASRAGSGSFWNKKSTEPVTLTIRLTNTGNSSYALDFLSFDAYRSYGDAPDRWSLRRAGGEELLSGEVPRTSGAPSADDENDFPDVDIDLGAQGLILSGGGTLELELEFSDSTPNAAGNLFVDNIAVLATAVDGARTGTVLAGWSEPGYQADRSEPGFRATMAADSWGAPKHGCGDRSFGSIAGASRGGSTASYWNNKTSAPLAMTFTVRNETGKPWNLDSVHFDTFRSFGDAMDQWNLSVSGVGMNAVTQSGTVERISDGPTADEENDFSDVDIDLRAHSLVMADGQKAVFRLEFEDSTPAAAGNLFVDNIAVVGSAVSE